MHIIRITHAEPACYGVMCSHHEHCARYHAAEGSPQVTVATCETYEGERPLYQPVKVGEAEKAVAA